MTSFIYSFLTDRYTTLTSINYPSILRFITNATTYSYYQYASATLATAITTATSRHLGEILVRWTKATYLYRWLTKEPEPDVIVIDLRDTISVGPFIALLDHLITLIIPASHRSRLVRTTTTIIRTYKQAPVRYTSILILLALTTNTVFSIVAGSGTQLGITVRLILLLVFLGGTQIRLTWPEVLDTRPVQLLIAALEPPDPPDWDDQ